MDKSLYLFFLFLKALDDWAQRSQYSLCLLLSFILLWSFAADVFFNYFPTSRLQICDSCPCLPRPGRLGYRCVMFPGSQLLAYPLISTAFSKIHETRVSRFTHEFFSLASHPNTRSYSLTPSHTLRLKEFTPEVSLAKFFYVPARF